jgi:hypothetical protein
MAASGRRTDGGMTEQVQRLSRTGWGRLLIAAIGSLIGIALATLIGLLLGRMAPLPDRVMVGLGLGGMLAVLLARARRP